MPRPTDLWADHPDPMVQRGRERRRTWRIGVSPAFQIKRQEWGADGTRIIHDARLLSVSLNTEPSIFPGAYVRLHPEQEHHAPQT